MSLALNTLRRLICHYQNKTKPDLMSAVVRRVSILPTNFNSPILFSSLFGTIKRAPIMTGITVTFMFHNFFGSLSRSWYLPSLLHSFIFNLWFIRCSTLGLFIKFASFSILWDRKKLCVINTNTASSSVFSLPLYLLLDTNCLTMAQMKMLVFSFFITFLCAKF